MPNSENVQSATLVILGTDLDPAAVTAGMSMQPWQSWSKGDHKSYALKSGARQKFKSIHEWGGWKHCVPDDRKHLDITDQLRYWVETLHSRAAFLQQMSARGFTIELNCCLIGDNTAAFRIPADIQKKLANLCVDLDITFYANESDEGAV